MGLRRGEIKILNALRKQPLGLSFMNLKNKTGLSAPALSEYLKRFSSTGYIIKDNRKYRLPIAFLNLDLSDRTMRMLMRLTTSVALSLGEKIHRIESRDERREAYRKYLEFYYDIVNRVFWRILFDTSEIMKGKIKAEKDIERGEERLKTVFLEWVLPVFQMILLVDNVNWDDHDVAERFYNEKTDQAIEITKEFIKLIRERLESKEQKLNVTPL